MEIKVIKRKFRNADFPPRFLNSVIHQFFTPKNNDLFIIPPDLSEEIKPFTLVEILYCEKNGNTSKHFIKKFEVFTNHRYRIGMKWIIRKLKSLFKVKDKTAHSSFVIYGGKCTFGEEYIGETERNVDKRQSAHNNPTVKNEPARHFSNNIGHLFTWEILMSVPKDKRKGLEALFITVQEPLLNYQVTSNVLHLFRNGIT